MIELLITLSVTAVLAAVVTPNLVNFIRNSRLTNGVNDLLHSLNLARTEAIKRQSGNVVVCGTIDPLAANAACQYNTFRGWIVFADTNGNWQRDNGEAIIERHAPIDASVTVRSDANANIVSYAPTGFGNPTDPAALRVPTRTLVLCDARGVVAVGNNSTARSQFISPTGRARASATYADVHDTALPLVGGSCP